MQEDHIIFDADGVLLDTLPYFIKWFFMNVPNFDIKKLLGRRCSYLLDEFSDDFENFSNIPPVKNAVETVKRLSKNYKIDVISTYGGNVHRFLARNENIEKFFGSSISRVFNMSRTFNKMDLYKTYPKNTIIIDDDLNNCNQAVQLGQKALWYKYYSLLSPIINKGNKHQHKIDKKQITPVSSFIEIEKLLSR